MVKTAAETTVETGEYNNYRFSRNEVKIKAIHFRSHVVCIYFEDDSSIVVSYDEGTGRLVHKAAVR